MHTGRDTLQTLPRMPQPDKRSVHEFAQPSLGEDLQNTFELKLAEPESKDAHVELLARSKKAVLPKLLAQLQRDELKDICRVHGLSEAGRENAVLVARLLGEPTEAEPDEPPRPALRPPPAHPTTSPTRSSLASST